MSDHRRLQRTLFRMQADPGFAHALLLGDEEAVASTALSPEDLRLLAGVEPAALSADPGGKRRTQIAGNAASEFRLTLAAVARCALAPEFLEAFLASPELHGAMARDGRLPLAFADYAARRAEEAGEATVGAIARLESAMARLRRAQSSPAARAPLRADEVRLSARAAVETLPAGTAAFAEALGRSLVEPCASPATPTLSGEELVLLTAEPAANGHRLGSVSVEVLSPPADLLLARARESLDAAARAAFAREHGAEPAELERFLDTFVADGVLERGPRPRTNPDPTGPR